MNDLAKLSVHELQQLLIRADTLANHLNDPTLNILLRRAFIRTKQPATDNPLSAKQTLDRLIPRATIQTSDDH